MNARSRQGETAPISQETLRENFARALQHHQAGRLAEAEPLYRRILAAAPQHDPSLNLLGVIGCQTGHAAQAIGLFEQAIARRGDVADYHYNLGLAQQQLGRFDAAGASFARAVALRPAYAEAHSNLGVVALQQGSAEAAIGHFERALALRPDYPEAHYNLGLLFDRQGRAAESLAALERAVALRPDYPDALYSLGAALQQQGRLDAAAQHYERAIAVRPGHAESWYGLGSARHLQGQAEAALACYEKVLALNPDFPDAQGNLALLLKDRGDLTGALARLDRALALKPDYPDAQMNRAMILLSLGDFDRGWAQLEARWQTRQLDPDRRSLAMPRWDGSDGHGRCMLVWAEQGLGDSLQFCRYVPLLAARGWRVVVEVPAPLQRLLGGLAPGVTVLPLGGAAGLAVDCHCPMMSLPLLFGTRLETIPAATPYLHAAPADIAHWQDRLAEAGPGKRIGLVWAGNPGRLSAMHAAVDIRRSIPLARLAPLLSVEGACFVSLQKDLPPSDRPADWGLVDPMPSVADFADTAAIVAGLDLVIAVDTSVVHLAGALGRPVWLLNRFDSDWRWLRGRDDSPWYPTLRQFRQAGPGDWDGVIAAVTAALRAWLAGSAP